MAGQNGTKMWGRVSSSQSLADLRFDVIKRKFCAFSHPALSLHYETSVVFLGFFSLDFWNLSPTQCLVLLAMFSSSTNRFRGMLIPLKLTSCFHCSVHRDYLYPFRFGTTSWQLNDYLQQLLKTFPSNEQMKNPDLNSCGVTNSSSISVLVPEQCVRDMYKI